MKKTPIQKLIDIIKSSKQEVDIQGMGICELLDYHGIEDKATELLEEEKQMVVDAFTDGVDFRNEMEVESFAGRDVDAEQYYCDTFEN